MKLKYNPKCLVCGREEGLNKIIMKLKWTSQTETNRETTKFK